MKADIGFERVTGSLGADVHGVELDGSAKPEDQDRLRQGLHHHGVLFFHYDHVLTPEEFMALGHLFGDPESQYGLSTTSDSNEGVVDSDKVPMRDFRVNCWHADGTCFERPPSAAMLTAVEVPSAGGDTMWSSMYGAWEALSSHFQRLLDGMEAVHSTARLPFLEQDMSTIHPVVVRHPATDRKLLYVNSNYTTRLVGLKDHESDRLLQVLFEHVNTPEFHVRHRWSPGDVAVWDETATQHRGVADFTGPRKLRRLTYAGQRPAA
jgi:taurine dioxygenase